MALRTQEVCQKLFFQLRVKRPNAQQFHKVRFSEAQHHTRGPPSPSSSSEMEGLGRGSQRWAVNFTNTFEDKRWYCVKKDEKNAGLLETLLSISSSLSPTKSILEASNNSRKS